MPHNQSQTNNRLPDFTYLGDSDYYLDSACQSLRPQPVIDSLEEYYHTYNACGERVKYRWGQKVDEAVADTRRAVLDFLKLSPRHYTVSFALNTTMGLNLLLQQLPIGHYKQIITSHIEHNSVFLSTITAARRLDVPRMVLDRDVDGALLYDPAQLEKAIVVVNSMSNVDGVKLTNIDQLVRDTHAHGGIVIIDAAQTMAHSSELLQKTAADAICFSAHKMYGASLGAVVARHELVESLEISIIGGGMVEDVTEHDYELLPDEELYARLEPGLQPWGEIIALGQAIKWLKTIRPNGQKPADYIHDLSTQLFDGFKAIPGLKIFNHDASAVISVYSDRHDAHQLALFLSEAGIMVRSGYFCAHHYLKEKLDMPPLLRFSLGLHLTKTDIDYTLATLSRFMKEL